VAQTVICVAVGSRSGPSLRTPSAEPRWCRVPATLRGGDHAPARAAVGLGDASPSGGAVLHMAPAFRGAARFPIFPKSVGYVLFIPFNPLWRLCRFGAPRSHRTPAWGRPLRRIRQL